MSIDDHLTLRWALLIVLFILSAFFAGSEVALFSLTRFQVDKLKSKKGRVGKKIAELLSAPQRLLVSIYIGNELVNVAISAVITILAMSLFGNQGLAIAIGVGAFFLLVFGEIAPKTFATHHNERFAIIVAYPLSIFMTLIYPVQVVVTWLSGLAVKMLGGNADIKQVIFTEEEILTLFGEGADDGVIDEGEREMIQNVFDLGDITVADIMTPRTDIVALPISTSVKDAWDKMASTTFARAPVYRSSIDAVEGILFKKDLLKLDYPPPEETSLSEIIRPPFIVPSTMTISELLREFKKRKIHIAIAMDEYGGVSGIATLDDIIRELVGDSMASGAARAEGIIKVAEDIYRMPASCPIEEFNEFFGVNLEIEDVETVGGYVFHLFGEPPHEGRKIEQGGFVFTAEKVTGHRLTTVIAMRSNNPGGEVEK